MSNYNPEEKRQKNFVVWGFIALLSALLLSQLAGEYIASIFVGFISVLMPILLAITIAYLLKKVVNFLEEKTFKKLFLKSKNADSKRRLLSLGVIFLVLIGIITVIIVSFIPAVLEIVTLLANNTDTYIDKITLQLTELASGFQFLENVDVQASIAESIENFAVSIENYLPQLVDQILNIATSTTMIILNIALAFLLSFLMLKDKEKIGAFFKRNIYANFKTFKADNILKTAKKSDKILYAYFIGKVIEATIILVLVGIGFYFLNIPYALILATVVAVLNFIPYVGAIIALIPVAFLTIIFGTVNAALWAIIYSGVVLIVVTSTISPVIFGKQLKISALIIILSILIGGGMFGILGMLFAPPVVAIIAVLVTENIKEKEEMKALARSHGLTEEDLMDEQLLMEAGKIMRINREKELKLKPIEKK